MGTNRAYTVLLAEDESELGATLCRLFEEDRDARRAQDPRAEWFEPFLGEDGAVQEPRAEVITEIALSPNGPDIVLLDNYLTVGDRGPEPAALRLMVDVARRSRPHGRTWPLFVLHTAGIDPCVAYTFRCAGGHHLIDKRMVPVLRDRVELLWRVLAGERWRPDPEPVPSFRGKRRAMLPYLEDPSITNAEIARDLDSSPGAVSQAFSEMHARLFPEERRDVADPVHPGDRPRMARRAMEGGHAWVPFGLRESLFGGEPLDLPFQPTRGMVAHERSRLRTLD